LFIQWVTSHISVTFVFSYSHACTQTWLAINDALVSLNYYKNCMKIAISFKWVFQQTDLFDCLNIKMAWEKNYRRISKIFSISFFYGKLLSDAFNFNVCTKMVSKMI
jgi:hypothetical protein